MPKDETLYWLYSDLLDGVREMLSDFKERKRYVEISHSSFERIWQAMKELGELD